METTNRDHFGMYTDIGNVLMARATRATIAATLAMSPLEALDRFTYEVEFEGFTERYFDDDKILAEVVKAANILNVLEGHGADLAEAYDTVVREAVAGEFERAMRAHLPRF